MIEKINEIQKLLIVQSVDEQPKMAINQMKILNILVDLRAEIEQLRIHDVSRRSEQLICPCCGSDKTYKTDAIHCNICAVTTEI